MEDDEGHKYVSSILAQSNAFMTITHWQLKCSVGLGVFGFGFRPWCLGRFFGRSSCRVLAGFVFVGFSFLPGLWLFRGSFPFGWSRFRSPFFVFRLSFCFCL